MQQKTIETHAPHYIAGTWQAGHGPLLTALCPLTNTPRWFARAADAADVALAYTAARQALAAWSLLGFEQRKSYLLRFATIVRSQAQQLALCIANETGKPLWEARTEVTAVVNKVQLSIAAYQTRTPEKQMIPDDETAMICYKPQGVVAVLGPFNFPAHLSNGHIVPALLAGNTIVYKPSELTPQVAQFVMQCWHASGLPPGVINCIQGDKYSAQALLAQDIQAVYFTGSYATGLAIHQAFASRPEVLLALEMGGNNPLIIDELKPGDIQAAVYHTLLSAFITAGQRCTCARRLFIPASQDGDHFLEQLIVAAEKLRIGAHTRDPEPFMGPVISAAYAKQHLQAQHTLCRQGGIPLLAMRALTDNSGLLSPGIIDMQQATAPPDEEIFAPLLQVYRYADFAAALALANQTRFGLVAGLMGDNARHFQLFYQTMRTGLIHWNKPTTGALSTLPFGGTGQSGNHRPSGYFAADYCGYPVAIQQIPVLSLPTSPLPGIYT